MDDSRHPAPPRRFLPPEWGPTDWPAIAEIVAELERRVIADPAGLETWLLDRSELDSAVAGRASRLAVAAARDTADAAAEAAHLVYQTEILPEYHRASDRLDRKYLACPARSGLDRERWRVHDRDTELAVELFREENVELEAEEEKLITEYGRISGGMTVPFRGAERTLAEMAPFAEETDRGLREEAWRAVAARRLGERERLDDLFDRMLSLRRRIAVNAGFADYRDYKHRALGRFDYSPADCLELHRSVERHVLPLVRRLSERRRRLLGLERLRPWDFAVDPEGRPPYRPFADSAGQVRLAAELIGRVDSGFAEELRWMERAGLLDLETRPNKRQGGFMDTFEDCRHPFIFANSPHTHAGIETLVHETGHAVHALLARHLEPVGYRSAPLEFCEVASMGLELLALEQLPAVYPAVEARRAALDSFEDVAASLAWTCTVDAFQHEVYTRPECGAEERARIWLDLRRRFGAPCDWTGLEEERRFGWQAQLHLFEVPFYYVEYALAQIGALQLWSAWRRDPEGAVARLRRGLALGGSRPLPDLYRAAGLRFDPRGETLPALVGELEAAWTELAGEPVG
ncbi:MAG: M3 family oligoendopeptidase [Planctomycetota bacterium]|nr:MAG: M3 family oligoendopeptidase [Planctomycetota bacterium]